MFNYVSPQQESYSALLASDYFRHHIRKRAHFHSDLCYELPLLLGFTRGDPLSEKYDSSVIQGHRRILRAVILTKSAGFPEIKEIAEQQSFFNIHFDSIRLPLVRHMMNSQSMHSLNFFTCSSCLTLNTAEHPAI